MSTQREIIPYQLAMDSIITTAEYALESMGPQGSVNNLMCKKLVKELTNVIKHMTDEARRLHGRDKK